MYLWDRSIDFSYVSTIFRFSVKVYSDYNAELSDEGNYKCFATNSIGTGSSQQGFLDVSGGEQMI
jgi:hypothetical protein